MSAGLRRLCAQAVGLGIPSVQLEFSRRLRLALTDGTAPSLLPRLGGGLLKCAAEVKAWQRRPPEEVGAPGRAEVVAQAARLAELMPK